MDIVPTLTEPQASAISKAAEWAVANKFLTALSRFATPVCIAAVGWVYVSVTTLIAASQDNSSKLVVLEQRLNDSRSTVLALTVDLGSARERVAQLQSLQSTQTTLDSRLTEFRQDLRDIRARLDQIGYGPGYRFQTPGNQ